MSLLRATVARRGALAVLACLAALPSLGCGYRVALAPHDISGARVERLGVRIFDNESREPNLERDLHREMSSAVHQFVDARLVRPSDADVVIAGTIEEVRRSPGTRTSQNRVLESAEAIRVSAALLQRRTGEVIRRSATYVQVGGILDVSDAEVDARARAVSVAAQRLVLQLLAREGEDGPAAEDDPAPR